MKVTGPNSGAPPPDAAVAPQDTKGKGKGEGKGTTGAEGTQDPGAAAKVESGRAEPSGKAFAEKLQGTTPTDAPGRTAAVKGPPDQLTADLAAELQAGRLQPGAAVEEVVSRILERQLGPDAPTAVKEQVRAALQDAIESDPLLAEKLSQLEA
jgi:hypothetical protein